MTEARNPFFQYFADIWSGIRTTVAGMRLTLSYFFKPKVTLQYPEEKPAIPAGHRGIHTYDEDQCLLCRACEAACPVDCLVINGFGRGRDRMIVNFEIDYSKCLFCNLCCEACSPKCILMGERYDLSASQRSGCMVEFARRKSEEEIRAHQDMLKEKEAQRAAAQQKKQQSTGEDQNGKS